MDLNCYICNVQTNIENCFKMRTKTQYSGISIHEIVQSFLKETHLLRFSANDIVCNNCFQKLNKYDLACRMANDIQQEITDALYVTENQYLCDENIEYLMDDEKNDANKNNYQNDFEDLQKCFEVQSEANDIENTNFDKETSRSTKSRQKAYCDDCNYTFGTKKDLKKHQFKHHVSKKCGICQKVFPNQMELRSHTRLIHEVDANEMSDSLDAFEKSMETIYRCSLCGMIESTENQLRQHEQLHENSLKCIICGVVVKHKGNLVLHMRIHTDRKFFKCDKCNKTFVHKSSLRMHLQTTHTDVRNKECPNCPLKFKTTSQLNQHLVTHTGEKKHECPDCKKTFSQRYNMTAHYKSTHLAIKSSRKVLKKPKNSDKKSCSNSDGKKIEEPCNSS